MNLTMTNELTNQFKALQTLTEQLSKASSKKDKINILNKLPSVQALDQFLHIREILDDSTLEQELIIKSLAAIGQTSIIFQNNENHPKLKQLLIELCKKLESVEQFYSFLGGIIGYHTQVIQLILNETSPSKQNKTDPSTLYLAPPPYELFHESKLVRKSIRKAIESLSELVEIYPVGGAGDRLDLRDETTNEPLPCAELLFGGRTLLEGLIRDLQAKEYLAYKLIGKQVIVPIVMMTSVEKRNSERVLGICQRNHWFMRKQESFHLIVQPLVPVVTIEGNWAVSSLCKLIFKPGGHGVIWKLIEEKGLIEDLKKKGISKALIRQINNPLAGHDYTLLAFSGIGMLEGKSFGFCSCPRLKGTAEGINTLVEKTSLNGFYYHISNIEYTDFIQAGVLDSSKQAESTYSTYPANTNILFSDLNAIKEAIKTHPLPSMLINMKHTTTCLNAEGNPHTVRAGRLESLMQNIADGMIDRFEKPLEKPQVENFKTYLTLNDRLKTISVTKKSYKPGEDCLETPQGAYYDLLYNAFDLLTNYCQIKIPRMPSLHDFLEKGPSFIFQYHPSLGPLYSIVAQKIHGGSLSNMSEVILEISELDWENVHLKGSLQIFADSVMGEQNEENHYSEQSGKCTLKNIRVLNLGIDKNVKNIFWNQTVNRRESMTISLHGNGEFLAENITFKGNFTIDVPNGYRITAKQNGDEVLFTSEPIMNPSWFWKYTFDGEDQIILCK